MVRKLVVLITVSVFASVACSDIIATASFEDNMPGPLDGQAGGTGWQGTWDEQNSNANSASYANVAAKTLTYTGTNFTVNGGSQAVKMTGASNDASASRQLAQTFSAGTGTDEVLYYRWMLRWETGNSDADDRCQVSLTEDRDKNGNPWWNKLRAGTRLSSAGDFMIHTDSGGPTNTGPENLQPADHPEGPSDTFMVVVKLHKAGDPNPFFYDYDLYVNPLDKTVESAEWTVIEKDGLHTPEVNWIGLIQRGLDAGDEYYVDNVVVATTWEEAVTGVPEPATLGILTLGTILIRRKK